MGICYSQQQQWQAYHKEIRQKRKNRKKKRNASIIYQQNSVYQNSFASRVQNSFRQDIFESISHVVFQSGSILTGGSSVAIGSIVQMGQDQIKLVLQSLPKINPDAQLHNLNQAVTLCNLKTKNFMHTHKVSHPDLPKINQVSCCPANANHIVEYDIWKFIKVQSVQESQSKSDSQTSQSHHQNQQSYYIYHPFTKKYLNYRKDYVVCTDEKKQWKIISFGPRRKGGFIKIVCDQGELCMTQERGLLSNHKKLEICNQMHVQHVWELRFGEIL